MRTVLFAALLGLVISSAFGKKVAFRDCGSQGGTILNVFITPCDKEPCSFARGEAVTVEFDFDSNVKSNNATLQATADILGIKLQLQLPQPDACKLIQCPLIPSKTAYKVVESIQVPNDVPSDPFPFPLQVILVGDNNANVVCGEVKVKVK